MLHGYHRREKVKNIGGGGGVFATLQSHFCFFLHFAHIQSVIYLLLVTSILCLKSSECMARAVENFGLCGLMRGSKGYVGLPLKLLEEPGPCPPSLLFQAYGYCLIVLQVSHV